MGFIVTWVLAFVYGKTAMFSEVFSEEIKESKEFKATHVKCQEDHAYQHDAPRACAKADSERDRWPFWRSIGVVISRTETCVGYPCSEIIRAVFDSWLAFAVACTVAGVVAFVACAGIFSRFERRPSQPEAVRVIMAYPHAAAQSAYSPAVMEAYDGDERPPVRAIDMGNAAYTPSMRQRLALLIGGGQGGHEKLV